MSYNTNLSAFGADAGIYSNRNYIINGNFDIWQRGTSQSGTGYGSDDRWSNVTVGSTETHSRQAFTLGQTDVPNNPTYFSRTAVTSVAGASNAAIKAQPMENVALLSGKTITLSFWAKADATKNMAVEFVQHFGTGGSPSAFVPSLLVTTIPLTTTWQKFTVTGTLPSIAGKTLGTDNNNSTIVYLWFDAGSGFNTRTNSLGQQSGTFDIAQVQVEEGNVATQFEFRHPQQELALCQRYFYRLTQPYLRGVVAGTSGTSTSISRLGAIHPTTMRGSPVPTMGGNLPLYDGTTPTTLASIGVNYSDSSIIEFDGVATVALAVGRPAIIYQTGSSYLDVSAEI